MTAANVSKRESLFEILGIERSPQNLIVAKALSDMLLRIEAVSAITGLSVPSLYRMMAAGTFPRAYKLSDKARAWKLSEIMRWLNMLERDTSELVTGRNDGVPA
jgi:predicted DNA-binding transcriptional regulator AlpA